MDTVEKRMTVPMLEDTIHSIIMRINHIETGTTTYSGIDAAAFNKTLDMNNPLDKRRAVKINPLSREQRALLARLDDSVTLLRTELHIRENAKLNRTKKR